MPREIEANALTNVEVEFISLVPNAASRLPFRLTKDEGALDYAELQEAFMKQEAEGAGTKLRAKRKDKSGARAAGAEGADGGQGPGQSQGGDETVPGSADARDGGTDTETDDTAVRARLEEGLTALAASLEALTRVITDFETRLSAAEVQVTKTERQLAGTVHGTPVGDPEAPVALAKSVGEPPLMDTGMGFYA